jgi:hypothetical protein
LDGATLPELPVTVPTPLKLREVSPVTLHSIVDFCPVVIEAGVAMRLLMVGVSLVVFGAVVEAADATAIVAVAVFVESALLVATTVAVPAVAGAVKSPEELMLPAETFQVTALFVVGP